MKNNRKRSRRPRKLERIVKELNEDEYCKSLKEVLVDSNRRTGGVVSNRTESGWLYDGCIHVSSRVTGTGLGELLYMRNL